MPHALAGLHADAVAHHFVVDPQRSVEKEQGGAADTLAHGVRDGRTGRHVVKRSVARRRTDVQCNRVFCHRAEIRSLGIVLEPERYFPRNRERGDLEAGCSSVRIHELHRLVEDQSAPLDELGVQDVEDGIGLEHTEHAGGGVKVSGCDSRRLSRPATWSTSDWSAPRRQSTVAKGASGEGWRTGFSAICWRRSGEA